MRALSRATLLLVAAVSYLAYAEDEVAQANRLFDQYVALSAAYRRKVADLYSDAPTSRTLGAIQTDSRAA